MKTGDILANAVAVAPRLREQAAENERLRRLSSETVDALRRAGAFRMPMPGAWGGPEVDILTQTEIIETLSAADGSAGWCAMIGSDSGFYSAFLDDDVGRALYPDLDMVTAGGVVPAGRLDVVPGGYRLSGRFTFASGIHHAGVVAAGAVAFDGGAMVTGPDGRPKWRVALMAKESFEVIDTWHTTGLAGSGSCDYVAENLFVPAEQTFAFADGAKRDGPLYAWPGMFIANAPGVPLGIARAALEVAKGVWADKMIVPDLRPARDDPRVRAALSRAEAMVGAARSYHYDVLGSLWDTVVAGDQPTLDQRAALAGSFPHTFQTCRDAVALLYEEIGSQSVYRSCPLDRHLRDLVTVGQHIMGQNRMREMAGGMWLGEPSPLPVL